MIDAHITELLEEWVTDRSPLWRRALDARALERQQALTAARRAAGRKGAARRAELRAANPAPHGFAAMTPERRREVASRGGKAAHASGNAHQWTPEEALAAGKKGALRGWTSKRGAGA